MRLKTIWALFVAALCWGGSATAAVQVNSFDDAPGFGIFGSYTSGLAGEPDLVYTPIQSQLPAGSEHIHVLDPVDKFLEYENDTGGVYVESAGLFDLLSLDLVDLHGLDFIFEGFTSPLASPFQDPGTPSVTQTITLGTAPGIVNFTGFTGLRAFRFYMDGGLGLALNVAGGAAIQFDDITIDTVNAVPIPAAVWLFGSGLVGLLGVSRRRVDDMAAA